MSSFRLAAVALLAIAVGTPVQAAQDYRAFDRSAFTAAQAEGLPILLDVHAWWCPVCASQARTIRQIVATGHYPRLMIFRIDYDKQQDVWRSFGVQKQATLIAYRGKTEVGRIAFKTEKIKIAELVASTGR